MEAPSWRQIVTNDGYHNSVASSVVTAVAKTVVAGCVAAVPVPEEVDDMEEGGGSGR